MATISIIVPAYNAESTILETLASVQKQTFSDFELIVIDNGSTDRTLELINTVQYSRLKILSLSPNRGVSVARNWGIFHSIGQFIALLDADDLWTSDKLELQLAALLKNPEAGVAYSWTLFMDKQGEYYHADEPIFLEGNVYADLLVKNFLASGSNPLIRRQAFEVGGFDLTLSSCEDWEFYLRLAARWPFVVIPKYQILYRQSSVSMSAKLGLVKEADFSVIEKSFQSAPQEVQYLKRQSLATVYQYWAELSLRYSINDVSEVKQAGQKLAMAIQLHRQLILNHKTQRLLIKWFFRRFLPATLVNPLLNLITKIRKKRIQRIKK